MSDSLMMVRVVMLLLLTVGWSDIFDTRMMVMFMMTVAMIV
jgi:hypothetical protein